MSEIDTKILEFSDKQSPWKQDVMRRLHQSGPLDAAGMADALKMCKMHHGLSVDQAPTPVPLTTAMLPGGDAGGLSTITLVALKDFQNVNALLPNQTLPFAEGLTSIFGNNGTGKSGYARVLKKLCRARGSVDPILADVFKEGAGEPTATVEFKIGDEEQRWSGSLGPSAADGPEGLGQIAVYDRASGSSFFSSNQKVELLPSGLEVLPAFQTVLTALQTSLKEEEKQDPRGVGFPELGDATAAGTFLKRLSAQTSVDALKDATSWTDAQQKQLEEVTTRLAELQAADPKKKAAEIEALADHLERLSTDLLKVQTDLRPAIADRVAEVFAAHRDAVQAQQASAGSSFDGDYLPGTGGGAWKILWEAARTFATEAAHPAVGFPDTGEDARCLLCQQDLDAASKLRLRAFEDFVLDEVAKKLKEANEDLANARAHLEGALPSRLRESRRQDEEIRVHPDLVGQLDAFLEKARQRREALLALLNGVATEEALPELSEAPVEGIQAWVQSQRAEAGRLRGLSVEEESIRLSKEKAELEARKRLSEHRPMLEAEVERLQRQEKREAAKKDCGTASLTRLVGKLTKEFVTEALIVAFNEELKALGGGHLRVVLEKASSKEGASYTKLGLRDAHQDKAVVGSVFSEGEQRVVALAAFFADLKISSCKSAIVFDDPVTSLDHLWREKVAQRLAKEATQRQVVVFTHDAVFLSMLVRACGGENASHSGLHVQRRGQKPGLCSDDPPWDTQKVKTRIETLRTTYFGLRKGREEMADDAYREAVVAFLGRLRNIWERAVEECLLNGSIQRFGLGVQTQRLAQVDVSSDDYRIIEKGMGACSAWVHDSAQPLATPPPTPDELAAMVNDLCDWVNHLRERRKAKGMNPQISALNGIVIKADR